MGPISMMALVLTVLGMLMFFGSRGLPDQAARLFPSHPMFRPAMAGGSRARPAGASNRLDGAALDALVHMDGTSGPSSSDDAPATASRRGGSRRMFSKRPW